MAPIIFHLEGRNPPFPRAHVLREDRRCCYDREYEAAGSDDFGPIYRIEERYDHFSVAFAAGGENPVYRHRPALGTEVWARAGRPELHHVRPAPVAGGAAEYYAGIADRIPAAVYLPRTGMEEGEGPAMLGAIPLLGGGASFGFYHPAAARVYLAGDFNDWQCPGHPAPDPARFLPMELRRGYGGRPNLWLRRVPEASPGQEYAFFVQGGVAVDGDLPPERYQVDPYARVYGRDRGRYNASIVDPSGYAWGDAGWRTPDPRDLIIYEMSVHGFTQGAPGVPGAEQGTFAGVARQIERGYFRDLGVTALAFMPTSEAPSFQGPRALGYDPCGFMTVERDFGTPDDLRRLVDTAHRHGLAVIMDAVFNHTANTFNPLWGAIDDGTPGGFYFSGGTPWGNRVATEKPEVQNMLIDACKLFLHEYHVDGFRFDATHSSWMDHGFLRRLASEIKDRGFKPDCLLIAENLPNEADLNLEGYNGFAQWCDPFHDKLKALLREGIYQDWVRDDPEHLGRIFYFCRDFYAAHTNNVVNFVESHDENSVPFEAATNPAAAAGPLDRSRKARLGLFAVLTALGQPMLYMGQEFGVDRPRNLVIFDWPGNPEEDPFHAWTRKLIHLRRNHPALRISGYNPAAEGKFTWLVGPWLDAARGGGRKAIGWRAEAADGDGAAVLINFSRDPIRADLDLGEGRWRLAADLERAGEEGWAEYEVAGRLEGFEIPPESGLLWLRA